MATWRSHYRVDENHRVLSIDDVMQSHNRIFNVHDRMERGWNCCLCLFHMWNDCAGRFHDTITKNASLEKHTLPPSHWTCVLPRVDDYRSHGWLLFSVTPAEYSFCTRIVLCLCFAAHSYGTIEAVLCSHSDPGIRDNENRVGFWNPVGWIFMCSVGDIYDASSMGASIYQFISYVKSALYFGLASP
jgi:hypothetical protein